MLAVSWLYLMALAAGAWVLGSWTVAWSVLAGGVVSIGSFWFSQRDVAAFIEALDAQTADGAAEAKKSKKGFILKFWLRILVIGLVLLGLIVSGRVHVIGLILGLTTVVFTVTFSALAAVWRFYFRRR